MKKMTWILIFMLYAPGWMLAQQFKPGDQNLLIMPTAETVPVHRAQLASYELVFLNVSWGLGSRTQMGLYTFFSRDSSFSRNCDGGGEAQLHQVPWDSKCGLGYSHAQGRCLFFW